MRKRMVLVAGVLALSLIMWTHSVLISVRGADIIQAEVDIEPDVLLWKEEGYGKYMTIYIKLPPEYDVSNISISSIVIKINLQEVPFVKSDIDNDRLMVKIDREFVLNLLLPLIMSPHMSPHVKQTVPVEVTGQVIGLNDNNFFIGNDWLKVFYTQLPQP